MTPTAEQLERWNDALDEEAAAMAVAGDPSLTRFARFNRAAALACTALRQQIGDVPGVDAFVQRFGRRHLFKRDLENLLDLAAQAAPTFGVPT